MEFPIHLYIDYYLNVTSHVCWFVLILSSPLLCIPFFLLGQSHLRYIAFHNMGGLEHSHWNCTLNSDVRHHKLKNITFSPFTFLSTDSWVTGHCVDCPESLFSVLSKYLHVTHLAFHWTNPAGLHLAGIWTPETFCLLQATNYKVKQRKTLLFTCKTMHSQCFRRIRADLGPMLVLPVQSIFIPIWTKQHLKGWDLNDT